MVKKKRENINSQKENLTIFDKIYIVWLYKGIDEFH